MNFQDTIRALMQICWAVPNAAASKALAVRQRMKKVIIALLVVVISVIFGSSGPAAACAVPPAELTKHHRELVRDSSQIALVRMIETKESSDMRFSGLAGPVVFQTIESLKGNTPEEFIFDRGLAATPGSQSEEITRDFDGHRQGVFWDKHITRQWNGPDCEMHPVFVPGVTYLLFLDHPHWRAYEVVRRDDDYWLAAVRNLIQDPSLSSGLTLSIKDWLSLSHGVFIGRVRSCSGPILEVVEPLFGNFEQEWRYSNEIDAGYWPRKTCEIGKKYLVITYQAEPDILPYYSSTIIDIEYGGVDFSDALSDSEVDVLGNRNVSIAELRKRLSER